MNSANKTQVYRNYRLVLLSVLHGLAHGAMIVFPVVLGSVKQEFAWSLHYSGWVAALGYGVFGLAAIPAGWLTDIVDRRRLLLVVCGGISLGLLIMGRAFHPLAFIGGWVITGFFCGMYHPLGLALIAGLFDETVGRAMAWHGVGGNITLALTPLLAGSIASIYSWRAAFLAVSLLGFFILGLLVLSKCSSVDKKSQLKENSANMPPLKKLWVILVVYGFSGFIYRGLVTFIPYSIGEQWTAEISLSEVGFLTTLILLFGIIGQYYGGRLADRISFIRLYFWQVIIYSALLALIPFTGNWFFIFWMCLWGVVYFSTQPVQHGFFARFGSEGNYGRLYGTGFLVKLGLGSLGAGVSGTVAEYTGVTGVYLVLAAISLASGLFLYQHRNKFI